ncbi:TonB-dependent receptor [Portibacter marinus]|uniref:TonB-dependent receptor n=1 Tax=Portibacter marinus TaxID=2898660 RepID=UPI001F45D376|nr:TonB-dependent receptor plug domain-containing protein [Portibacter marinus]
MKTSFLLLFTLIFANPIYGQIEYEEAKQVLEKAFNVQIHCPKKFQPSQVALLENVSDHSLEENMDALLNNTTLVFFKYNEGHIIIGPENIIEGEIKEVSVKAENELLRENEPQFESYAVGDPQNIVKVGEHEIKLYIYDDNLKDGLIGVTAIVQESDQASITDEIGIVELSLGTGNYLIDINYLGYLSKTIQLNVFGPGRVEIALSKEAVTLEEVTISASAGQNSITREEIGLEALSAREIKRVPALMGEADVIKSLLLLPGVSTVGEGSSGINIRGGSVDQNLILQDGIPLFNASHVLGLFSLFNPDVVQSIELYKGSLPARFGGRVASVMDVELKEGDFTRWKGTGGLGLISSRLTFEGPIIPEKVSLLLGGRFSFSDYIFSSIRVAEIRESRANFYDGNAKLTFRLGSKGKLKLSAYNSYDRFKFDDNFDFNWRTTAGSANFNYVFNPGTSLIVKSSYSNYLSELIDPTVGSSFSYSNGISNFKLKPYLQLNDFLTLNAFAGLEINHYNIASGSIAPLTDESSQTEFDLDPQKGLEVAAFIDLTKNLSDYISLTAGLRYSQFRNLGPGEIKIYEEGEERIRENVQDIKTVGNNKVLKFFDAFEPRTSLKVITSPISSLKMSFNITNQYISQLFNTTSVTPVDLWYASNTYVDPIRAFNYSLGYFLSLDENKWENSLEVFYRDIKNTIEYKDIAELFLNPFVETELLNAIGRAYGVEFSIKKNIGRITGRLSYTYSRTESKTQGIFPRERINNNNWFPSNYDRPHDLSLISTLQITQRSYASVNFVYSSGRPVSAPTGNISVGNVRNIPVYGSRNNFRIPDYHRMDFSYTVEQSHKKDQKWRSSWTFSVYNLYGRRNAFSVFFTQKPFQSPVANRLSILARPIPSLTYNFNF